MAQSVTETVEAMQQFADVEVARDIEHALGEMNKERTGFWGGIERVLDWLRTKVRLPVRVLFYTTIFA